MANGRPGTSTGRRASAACTLLLCSRPSLSGIRPRRHSFPVTGAGAELEVLLADGSDSSGWVFIGRCSWTQRHAVCVRYPSYNAVCADLT
jgi:hypothetical protein